MSNSHEKYELTRVNAFKPSYPQRTSVQPIRICTFYAQKDPRFDSFSVLVTNISTHSFTFRSKTSRIIKIFSDSVDAGYSTREKNMQF